MRIWKCCWGLSYVSYLLGMMNFSFSVELLRIFSRGWLGCVNCCLCIFCLVMWLVKGVVIVYLVSSVWLVVMLVWVFLNLVCDILSLILLIEFSLVSWWLVF